MKKVITFLIAFALPIILFADWERNVLPNINGNCVIEASNGDFVIAGYNSVVRTDNLGHLIWFRNYETIVSARSIVEDSYGNFVFTGLIDTEPGDGNICAFKISFSGDSIWVQNYGHPESGDYGMSIIEAIDGGFIIGGSRGSFLYSPMASILHIDPSGDTLWTRDYGGHGVDYCYSVVRFGEEGYLMAGHTSSGPSPSYMYYVIRTGLRGDTLWTRTFNYSPGYTSWGRSIAYLEDERCAIVAGFCDSVGFHNYQIYLVKIDEWGDTVWTKTYGGSSDDYPLSICATTDGGCVVAGLTNSYGAGGSDMYVLRIDSDGDTLWTRTFGGPQNDLGNSIIQSSDGGFVITGSYGGLSISYLYLVKIDPTGIVEWKSEFPLDFSLSAHPNPFNSAVLISAPGNAKVEIFDIDGRKIGELPGGEQVWKPEPSVGSGIYLVRATVGPSTGSGTETITKRVVYLK